MIDIDIGQVVHLLQMQVARVIEHIAARMVIHPREKTLKGHAIVQVFAGVDLVADIDPLLVEEVQQRPPAPGQLGKGLIQKRLIVRRPRIKKGPCQRPGKGRVRLQPQAAGGYRRLAHFLHRPALARLRIAMQRRRGKGVKRRVIRWMHRHQLSFKVSGQLADHQPMLRQDAADLVAVGLARRRPLDIKNRRVVAGDLQCLVPQAGGPLRHPRQGVERRLRADKLRQKNARSLNRFHTPS